MIKNIEGMDERKNSRKIFLQNKENIYRKEKKYNYLYLKMNRKNSTFNLV
jgi:hypothetical protein